MSSNSRSIIFQKQTNGKKRSDLWLQGKGVGDGEIG